MQNLPQPISSANLSTVSDAGLEKALRYLTADHRPTEHTALLPPHVCHAVIARHSGPWPATPRRAAREAATVLAAGFAHGLGGDKDNLQAYLTRLSQVFEKYPEFIVQKVTAAGYRFHGDPAFRPSDKEVAAALEKELTEYRAYAWRAKQHLAEHARRAEEARFDASWGNVPPDQRKRKIDALARSYRAMNEGGAS